MFRRSVNLEILILINGERCYIREALKILRYFSSKTKNITNINIYDHTSLRYHEFSSSFWNILLENCEKNNWKLKVLNVSTRMNTEELVRRFLNLAKDTLEELTYRPIFPFYHALYSTATNFPAEEVSQCLKLQKLDMGSFDFEFDLNTLGPLLQPSQLSLVELRIDLSENATATLVAILKRFRNTLKEIHCTPSRKISLGQLLNEFEETTEPNQTLQQLSSSWLSDLPKDSTVEKLFHLFPNLQSMGTCTYFNGKSLYQFARDFLDLFQYDSTTVRKFTITSNCYVVYYDYDLKPLGNRLLEAFPPPLYKWVIKATNIEEPSKIVIQRGYAQIILLCDCFESE